MPLDSTERELVAVGASLGAGSMPCARLYLERVRSAGAAAEQMRLAIAESMRVRRRATEIIELHALQRVDGGSEGEVFDPAADTRRIRALVSIGAAFAVGCPTILETRLREAARAGLTPDEIAEVQERSIEVRRDAASRVDRWALLRPTLRPPGSAGELMEPACC